MKSHLEKLDRESEFWNFEWLNESKLSKTMLSFSRNVPWIQQRLLSVLKDDLNRALLGEEISKPIQTSNVEYDIWATRAWFESENPVEQGWALDLEQRAEEMDPILHIEAASLHVKTSMPREMLSRQRLCSMDIPFVFPGDVLPLHIELFAGGEKALHVLHVELLRKLGMLIIDSLEQDCHNRAAWLLPLIEVLPERKLQKQIQQLTNAPSRKNQRLFMGGGWGLLATYAQRIGMDVEPILDRGNELDHFYWIVMSEMIRHTAVDN